MVSIKLTENSSFSKPRPDFWGRGCRPRPRNEQAKDEKCFRGSLFSTEVTWEKLKSDVDQISSEESSQHNYQNRMLFSFVWLFRRFHQAIRLWNSFDIFWSVFWLYPMKKIFIWFLAKSQDSEPFSKKFSFRLGQIYTYV